MPRVIKRKNRKTTKWERHFCACKTCGAMFDSEQALRIHKGKEKHWTTALDREKVEQVEIAFEIAQREVNTPDAPSVVEVVDESLKTEIVNTDNSREIIKTEIVSGASSVSKAVHRLKKIEEDRNNRKAHKIPVLIDPAGRVNYDSIDECLESDRYIDPVKCNISEITVGSILLLNAHVWKRRGNQFENFYITEPVEGVVTNRWVDSSAEYYLDVEVSGTKYTCNEKLVISPLSEPQIKLLQYGKEKILFTKKPIGTDEESLVFYEALKEYFKALENLENAKKYLKKIEVLKKPTIVNYLVKYGIPSAENSKDSLIKDAGFKVQYTYEEQDEQVFLKNSHVISELLKKGLTHLMRSEYVINDDLWKKIKEMGIFTDEELRSLEYSERPDPVRKIIIERIVEGL